VSEEAFVVVKDLRKAFNGTVAVDGVSFSIEKGEIFGLLGPNGAGKTTTFYMIVGLIGPTRAASRWPTGMAARSSSACRCT